MCMSNTSMGECDGFRWASREGGTCILTVGSTRKLEPHMPRPEIDDGAQDLVPRVLLVEVRVVVDVAL
jgi:hypothetical protein